MVELSNTDGVHQGDFTFSLGRYGVEFWEGTEGVLSILSDFIRYYVQIGWEGWNKGRQREDEMPKEKEKK